MTSNHKKLFIINDDELVCLILGDMAKQINKSVSVKKFYRCSEALEYLYMEKSKGVFLDNNSIIFLDAELPVIDGEGFLKAFEKYFPNSLENPFIYIITATATESIKQFSKRFSIVADVIELPLSKQQFTRCLA